MEGRCVWHLVECHLFPQIALELSHPRYIGEVAREIFTAYNVNSLAAGILRVLNYNTYRI
jgi:hypothetical protein